MPEVAARVPSVRGGSKRRDAVRLDHTVALYEALPNGQLCVVPAASHFLPLEQPEETLKVIQRFLGSNAHPETLFPIRRK